MTPTYIRDVYTRRGHEAAMQVAKVSQEESLINEVMLMSFEKTGVAKPIPVFSRNKRGKVTQTGMTEGATPEELATVKMLRERRKTRTTKPNIVKATSRLTAAEIARRTAAFKAAA